MERVERAHSVVDGPGRRHAKSYWHGDRWTAPTPKPKLARSRLPNFPHLGEKMSDDILRPLGEKRAAELRERVPFMLRGE